MALPNLVIAGAPRCGTSSLFAWLANHPEVCGASVKETKYLLDRGSYSFDPRSNIHTQGIAGYESYFSHCDGRSRAIVEATPGYIYQKIAPLVLSSLEPLPQIVFILRKPSDRVYSAYHWAKFYLTELEPHVSFREYVERLRDEDPAKRLNDAIDRSQYVDYLANWLACFPQPNLRVVLFEHLRERPTDVMKSLAEWIGISGAFFDEYDFPHENTTHEVRRPQLHHAMLRMTRMMAPGLVRQPRSGEVRGASFLARALGKAYAAVNIKTQAPTQTSDDNRVLTELDRHFAPYNDRLAREMALNLGQWT